MMRRSYCLVLQAPILQARVPEADTDSDKRWLAVVSAVKSTILKSTMFIMESKAVDVNFNYQNISYCQGVCTANVCQSTP